MPLTLAGLTTGSTTIQATDNTTQTITLPANSGTVMVNGPTFSAYSNAGQSISNAVFTKLQYATKDWDTNNNYDNTTNYRFTPTVAGYYQVSANVYLNGGNSMQLSLYKNGSEYIRFTQLSGFNICGSALVYFNGSTDYVEIYMYNGNGSSVSVNGYSFNKFQAAMVRSA